jgi:hypothetical protein
MEYVFILKIIDERNIWRNRKEAALVWRKLHNEELHSLLSLLNIRLVKSRRMGWVGHVACMGEKQNFMVYFTVLLVLQWLSCFGTAGVSLLVTT